MDNDDLPVGRLLTRREMLKLLASVSAAAMVSACVPRLPGSATPVATPAATGTTAAATAAPTSTATAVPTSAAVATATAESVAAATAVLPACVVRPEMTEGPFFVDEMLNRSDVRSDPSDGSVRDGALLGLTFLVSRIGTACEPLPGAMVDIWQCDADGVYSDVVDFGTGDSAVGQKFLRGYQLTDQNGVASFTTIYPGWYQGRTVHIHFKIRTEEGGVNHEFTSQLFFDDALTDQVYAIPPYVARGQRSTLNANDGIFQAGGDQLTLTVTPTVEGFAATFDIGLDMS